MLNIRMIICAASIIFLSAPLQSTFAQDTDPVLTALSSRDMSLNVGQLEQLAGGKEQLVQRLLQLRTQENPPFAGVRSEKLLLQYYADRPEVRAALEEDVQSPTMKGLAKIISLNINDTKDAQTRRSLAKLALERGAADEEFAKVTRHLKDSPDPEISKMAREQLK